MMQMIQTRDGESITWLEWARRVCQTWVALIDTHLALTSQVDALTRLIFTGASVDEIRAAAATLQRAVDASRVGMRDQRAACTEVAADVAHAQRRAVQRPPDNTPRVH